MRGGGEIHGSVQHFTGLLAKAGVEWGTFLEQFENYDLKDFSNLIQYLRTAIINGQVSEEQVRFHLELMRSVAPKRIPEWRNLVQHLKYRTTLSDETRAFVREHGIADFLHQMLMARLNIQTVSPVSPRTCPEAFLRSTLRTLELHGQLTREDPNLAVIFSLIARHGGIQEYYAADPVPQRAVLRMAACGFDTDYLVFGDQEIATDGPSDEDLAETWVTFLDRTVRSMVGTRDSEPELPLNVDRFRFFHQIRADFDLVVKERDPAAALRLIDQLLPRLTERESSLVRAGDIMTASQFSSLADRFRHYSRLLRGELDEIPKPQSLRAVRSRKLVPELLFDNTRLACCLFKPQGLFHGEICRLILDPATPMIEYWLDPYSEFLGLATLYPGRNAQGQATVLMDTVDYDDRLLELKGYNGTMRFMLKSMVADAARSGAEKLVIFAAPYGKPIGFANYVKLLEKRTSSITYHESYFFESCDPEDSALAKSVLGHHHYTCAFGYDVGMSGMINYGYNLVGYGVVNRYYDGGRGAYEIDLAAFRAEFGVETPDADAIGRPPQKGRVAGAFPPKRHHDEIDRRTRGVLEETRDVLRLTIKNPCFEVHAGRLPESIMDRIREIEQETFDVGLRYTTEQFQARMLEQGATMIVLHSDQTPVAFLLFYVSPILQPRDHLYADAMSIAPAYQNLGIGSALMQAFKRIALLRGYRRVYLMVRGGPAFLGLQYFYQKSNFVYRSNMGELGHMMEAEISCHDPEYIDRIGEYVDDAVQQIRDVCANPRIEVLTRREETLGDRISKIEATFGDEIGHTEGQLRELVMSKPDAMIVLALDQGNLTGVVLGYRNPDLGSHVFVLHFLHVGTGYRRTRLGLVMASLLRKIAALGSYTELAFEASDSPDDYLKDLLAPLEARPVATGNKRALFKAPIVGEWVPETAESRAPRMPVTSAPDSEAPADQPSAETDEQETGTAEEPAPAAGSAVIEGSPTEQLSLSEELGRLVGGQKASRLLREEGVVTVGELLARAAKVSGRALLATKVQARPEQLLATVLVAELCRAGATSKEAQALRKFGVSSLKDLKDLDIGALPESAFELLSRERLEHLRVQAQPLESIVEI